MATYYHGTTLANWQSIERHGFGTEKPDYTWECSCDDYLYLWDLSKFLDEWEKGDSAKAAAIHRAFESAQITAAIEGQKENALIVLELNIDENKVLPDESCSNMHMAARIELRNLDPDNITQVYQCQGYNPELRLFILTGLVDSDLIRLDTIDADIYTAAQLVKGLDYSAVFEFMTDFSDYRQIRIPNDSKVVAA